MVNRPSEREQVLLIKKNLQPNFRKTLGPIPMATFRDLLDAGTYIEDEQQDNAKMKTEGANQGKGKKSIPDKAAEVHAAFGPSYHHNQSYQSYPPNNLAYPPTYPAYQITPPPYPTPTTSNYPRPHPSYQRMPPPNPTFRRRYFDPLGKPLSEVFSKLMKRGMLKPLDPQPLRFPLSANHDPNSYCEYHQNVGHPTDRCRTLQNSIQDLIDQKIIPPPQAPNISHNPLPNHYHQANLISTYLPFDPSHYILPSTLPKPHVVIWEVNDSRMMKQSDQGNFRGSSDNEEEPKSAKGKDICLWEDPKKEVGTTLTLELGYESTKEGEATPNYGTPEP